MSIALVTGASGFVGGHLVESLIQAGVSVRCLVRPSSDTLLLDSLDVEKVVGDLSTGNDWKKVLGNVDTVYHVAALTRALRAGQLRQVNATGTHLLAKACALQPNPPRLIVVSSLAARGTSRDSRLPRDHAQARPVSRYGCSKRAAEFAACRWARAVPTTIVRPGVVFGPRDRDTAVLFRSIKTLGIYPLPGFRWASLAVIDVRDLVELMRRAATLGKTVDPEATGVGFYDAADSLTPTCAELGRLIGRAVGRPNVLMIHCPVPLLMSAACVAEMVARLRRRQLAFNLDKMRDATAGSWACDADRSQSELGFRPTLTFEERLRQTAQWYEQAGWL